MRSFTQFFARPLLLAMAMALMMSIAAPARAATDPPGASDLPGIERYPLSYIDFYEQRAVPQYRLALGSMRKVNGVVFPEHERYVEGYLTRITYRIPDGRSSEEAFDFLLRTLDLEPEQVLFTCRGRDCGSSSQWANTQFELSNLYGIDREQYYLAARLEGQSPGYLAAYAIRRGNGRVYLHLDHIQPPRPAIDQGTVTVVLRLSQGERVYLEPEDNQRRLRVLVQALEEMLDDDKGRQVLLVGHEPAVGEPGASRQASLETAEALREYLAGKGLPGPRLNAFGVGALAPAYDDEIPVRRIEVLVR